MNVYIRNIIIVLIVNIVVFVIGWGCIVPDTINDQTHLFGLIGDVEIIRGNTAVVFGVCAIMSTLTLIVGLVEAIVEDYRPQCPTRVGRKLPTGTFANNNKMRIVDPSSAKVDEDPKTPTL